VPASIHDLIFALVDTIDFDILRKLELVAEKGHLVPKLLCYCSVYLTLGLI